MRLAPKKHTPRSLMRGAAGIGGLLLAALRSFSYSWLASAQFNSIAHSLELRGLFSDLCHQNLQTLLLLSDHRPEFSDRRFLFLDLMALLFQFVALLRDSVMCFKKLV